MSTQSSEVPKRRVALVVGATGGGFSQALTDALLSVPDKYVVYAGVRSVAKGARVFQGEEQQNFPTLVPLDLSDPLPKMKALVESIEQEHGGIDLLVNSAGMGRNWPLECETDDTLRETFEVNAMGPMRLCQAVLPGMKRRGRGQIVNVSSVGGLVPAEMCEVYNGSKYAIVGFSESLSLTARHFGIKVSVVAPGPMNTPALWESLVKDYPREVCCKRTQALIDAKFPLMEDFRGMSAAIAEPREAARLVLDNVIENAEPPLFYLMNFGLDQDKLDAKYADLAAYGESLAKA